MTAPPGPAAQAAPNRLVRNVIIASILGALVFAALSAYGDVDALRTRLGEFQVGAFLIALALVTGNIALRFGRWELYLRYLGLRVSVLESVLVFLSGFVMSVTPAKLGEVLKSVLLWESHRVPIERSAPIVLAERFTDLIALLLIMAVGATRFSFGLPLALGGFLLCGFILTVCLWERLGVALLGTIGRVPRLRGLAARLQAAYAALRSLCLPGPLLAATALALLGWSLEVVAAVQIVQGFGA
ncbi:MAG: flippase-like domain-containing protein, partial [Myxococcales bacterium]|nr:flippase-like domain-containing protein [Myxococcales bacterium]